MKLPADNITETETGLDRIDPKLRGRQPIYGRMRLKRNPSGVVNDSNAPSGSDCVLPSRRAAVSLLPDGSSAFTLGVVLSLATSTPCGVLAGSGFV